MSKDNNKLIFRINGRETINEHYRFDKPLPSHGLVFQEIFDIWKKSFKGTKFPSYKDIRFENLLGWHSNIKITSIGKNIDQEKRNIIMGEKYRQYWGNDTLVNEIAKVEDAKERKALLKLYSGILGNLYAKHYLLSYGNCPNNDGSYSKLKWIDLPLADDGENISHILSAVMPMK